MSTREILFRGKRIDNGQWVYGFLWSERVIATESVLGSIDEVVIDPATVGEYTGLQDTHGNRVFEGDILKLTREWTVCSRVIFSNSLVNGVKGILMFGMR